MSTTVAGPSTQPASEVELRYVHKIQVNCARGLIYEWRTLASLVSIAQIQGATLLLMHSRRRCGSHFLAKATEEEDQDHRRAGWKETQS